jgi:hypothetical protein
MRQFWMLLVLGIAGIVTGSIGMAIVDRPAGTADYEAAATPSGASSIVWSVGSDRSKGIL